MKQNVSKSEFIDGFKIRDGQFSYDGLRALYDYLIELEDDTGEELEFDPIGICCEFSEFESLQEFRNDYGDEFETMEDVDTMVIPVNDEAFIVQNF